MPEGVVNWDVSHTETVYQLIVVRKIIVNLIEMIVYLSDGSIDSIETVVVVKDSWFASGLQLIFVGSRANKILVWFSFPNAWDTYLWVVGFVLSSKVIGNSYNFEFSVWIILEIKKVEGDLLLMLGSSPEDFGVIICFENGVVISPFVILGHVDSYRLAVLLQVIIGIIRKPEPMVVKTSLFLDAEQSGVREVVDGHIDGILEIVWVVDWPHGLMFEVDDFNLTLRDVEDNDFFVIHLSKSVNDLVVSAFI